MSNKNLSLNKANWKKLDELMKQTNKSTRQAAIAEVLDKAAGRDYWKDLHELSDKDRAANLKTCMHYFELCSKLKENIFLYRISFVVLAIVAIAGWVL